MVIVKKTPTQVEASPGAGDEYQHPDGAAAVEEQGRVPDFHAFLLCRNSADRPALRYSLQRIGLLITSIARTGDASTWWGSFHDDHDNAGAPSLQLPRNVLYQSRQKYH